jgi:hypothetical protein
MADFDINELRNMIDSPQQPQKTTSLSAEQQAKLDKIIEAQRAHDRSVAESLLTTRQSIEKDGYLYHYAPRSARESILSEGLVPSKAVTGDVFENGIYFFTNPNDAPSAGFMSVYKEDYGKAVTEEGADLFRVKVQPGMLDEMVIDKKLPIRGDVASAVVVPTKTGSFAVELIGENAKFESSGELLDLFSKASYDPILPKPVTMSADDFIGLVKNNKQDLINAVNNESFDHIKVSDIFAKHLGFDKPSLSVTDDQLDSLIKFGDSVEITRGFGSQEVLETFLSGKSGFGDYDDGGVGHYFAMETLDETQASKLGLTVDPQKRGGKGPSMTYQASHYAGEEGKTMIRGALLPDAKVVSKKGILGEISDLREGNGKGQLSLFRSELTKTKNKEALDIFDAIFSSKVNAEYTSAIAAMILRL